MRRTDSAPAASLVCRRKPRHTPHRHTSKEIRNRSAAGQGTAIRRHPDIGPTSERPNRRASAGVLCRCAVPAHRQGDENGAIRPFPSSQRTLPKHAARRDGPAAQLFRTVNDRLHVHRHGGTIHRIDSPDTTGREPVDENSSIRKQPTFYRLRAETAGEKTQELSTGECSRTPSSGPAAIRLPTLSQSYREVSRANRSSGKRTTCEYPGMRRCIRSPYEQTATRRTADCGGKGRRRRSDKKSRQQNTGTAARTITIGKTGDARHPVSTSFRDLPFRGTTVPVPNTSENGGT